MGLLRSPLGRAGAIGTVAAAVVNLIIYGIGSAAGVDWDAGDYDPNAIAVVLSTIAAGAILTIIAMILLRYAKVKQPTLSFVILAAILTLLSMAAPFGADAETSTQTILALMYLVAGVLITGALARAVSAEERLIAG